MIKLYRFTEGNPETDIYVCSTYTKEKDIRSFCQINDHGGMPYEDYERVATKGKIEEISSVEQVRDEDLDTIPYQTDEWVESLGKYLFIDVTIRDLLS